MFRLATLSAFVIFGIANVGHASITECARVSELAAARARWGIGKINASDSAHKQEVCRAYVGYFTVAVLIRHAIFVCGQGAHASGIWMSSILRSRVSTISSRRTQASKVILIHGADHNDLRIGSTATEVKMPSDFGASQRQCWTVTTEIVKIA
jgi:hypothetical protein